MMGLELSNSDGYGKGGPFIDAIPDHLKSPRQRGFMTANAGGAGGTSAGQPYSSKTGKSGGGGTPRTNLAQSWNRPQQMNAMSAWNTYNA